MKKCKHIEFPVINSEFICTSDALFINRHGLIETFKKDIYNHFGGIRKLKSVVHGANFWKLHLKRDYHPYEMQYILVDHNKFK